jgi:hypothetical protein
MATGTAGSTARHYSTCQISYLRRDITFADAGTVVVVGTLPAGAQILRPISGVYVGVAFNGDTTNTVSIGPTSDSGTDLWATSLALGAVAFVTIDEAVTNLVAADTSVSATVTSTATPTAGTGTIVIAYIEDNDR